MDQPLVAQHNLGLLRPGELAALRQSCTVGYVEAGTVVAAAGSPATHVMAVGDAVDTAELAVVAAGLQSASMTLLLVALSVGHGPARVADPRSGAPALPPASVAGCDVEVAPDPVVTTLSCESTRRSHHEAVVGVARSDLTDRRVGQITLGECLLDCGRVDHPSVSDFDDRDVHGSAAARSKLGGPSQEDPTVFQRTLPVPVVAVAKAGSLPLSYRVPQRHCKGTNISVCILDRLSSYLPER